MELTLKDLLEKQVEFNQGKFIDYFTATYEERMTLSKDLLLHLLHEVHEVLDHLDWKMHKKSSEPIDKFATAVELIDVLKFWAAIPGIWGISPELLEQVYVKKSAIVEGRWFVEQQYKSLVQEQKSYKAVFELPSAEFFSNLHIRELNNLFELIKKVEPICVIIKNKSKLSSAHLFELEHLLTGQAKIKWFFSDESCKEQDRILQLAKLNVKIEHNRLYRIRFALNSSGYRTVQNLWTMDEVIQELNEFLEGKEV